MGSFASRRPLYGAQRLAQASHQWNIFIPRLRGKQYADSLPGNCENEQPYPSDLSHEKPWSIGVVNEGREAGKVRLPLGAQGVRMRRADPQ